MEKNQNGVHVPEGKMVGVLALYSTLETCNHLKEDRVEVSTLLEPHLIKTKYLIETLVPRQTFQMKRKMARENNFSLSLTFGWNEFIDELCISLLDG